MIFILDEDRTLAVRDSEKECQGAFEGVDVEDDNVYKFFDEKGKPLVPEFIEPNRRSKFLWLGIIQSGTYRLLPAKPGTHPQILDIWDSIVGLNRNTHFSSLDEVRQYLQN